MLIALPHSQWSSTAPLVYGALSAPPGGEGRAVGEEELRFDAYLVLQHGPDFRFRRIAVRRMDGLGSLVAHLPHRAERRQLEPGNLDRLARCRVGVDGVFKIEVARLFIRRGKGYRPEGLHIHVLVGHMHEKRKAVRAERRRGLFEKHVLHDALERQRLRLSVVGVLQNGVADCLLPVQRETGRKPRRGKAADTGAVDAPGEVERTRVSGIIGDAFLAHRGNVYIDTLQISGVYGGEQYKFGLRRLCF